MDTLTHVIHWLTHAGPFIQDPVVVETNEKRVKDFVTSSDTWSQLSKTKKVGSKADVLGHDMAMSPRGMTMRTMSSKTGSMFGKKTMSAATMGGRTTMGGTTCSMTMRQLADVYAAAATIREVSEESE